MMHNSKRVSVALWGFPKPEQLYPEGSCTNESPLAQLPKPHFYSLGKIKHSSDAQSYQTFITTHGQTQSSKQAYFSHTSTCFTPSSRQGWESCWRWLLGAASGSDLAHRPFPPSINLYNMENKITHSTHHSLSYGVLEWLQFSLRFTFMTLFEL